MSDQLYWSGDVGRAYVRALRPLVTVPNRWLYRLVTAPPELVAPGARLAAIVELHRRNDALLRRARRDRLRETAEKDALDE